MARCEERLVACWCMASAYLRISSILASAAGGAGRDMLIGGCGEDVSKLKTSLSCPAVGLRGCGDGERPNPALDRVGSPRDPLGVWTMRFGSSSWLRGVSTKLLLERVGLFSDMKGFLVGRMKEGGGSGQKSLVVSVCLCLRDSMV